MWSATKQPPFATSWPTGTTEHERHATTTTTTQLIAHDGPGVLGAFTELPEKLKQGCRSGHGVLGAFTELPWPADSVKVSPAIAA